MKTIGIIAEYNPFHNGHAYQIEAVKEMFGADAVVAVMSGDFVQRGGAAFADKRLRARMALDGGADFVFELPAAYSTASAEIFALGGVAMLEALGFVDGICFGCECPDLGLLEELADVFLDRRGELDAMIKEFTKSGYSYPAARHKAASKLCPEALKDGLKAAAAPNNILAIEYLKALKRLKSDIDAYPLKRRGASHDDVNYGANRLYPREDGARFASAAAIRSAFENEPDPFAAVGGFVPKETFRALKENTGRINVGDAMFSDMLYYKIRSLMSRADPCGELMTYCDVSEEIARRIIKNIGRYDDFAGFAATLKTKQYTYSRICRALIHILLDVRRTDLPFESLGAGARLDARKITPYARLLGLNTKKSGLLKKAPSGMVAVSAANAFKHAEEADDERAKRMLEIDIFAADVYRYAAGRGTGEKNALPDEYRAGVEIK